MAERLLLFAMALTRVSGFFLVAPVFSWRTIPVRIKISMTFLLAMFYSMMMPAGTVSGDIPILKVVLLMANEATYGLALGLIAVTIFSAVKVSGRIIERQMGLAMAATLDPLTGQNAQPVGMLVEMIFILLFLSANGHHLFLMVIARSYEAFPAGSMPTASVIAGGVVEAGSTMLVAALRLAAPMLGAFMVLTVALALLARLAPEMNILFISMPLRVGLGLLMAAVFLPFINSFVSEFADLMGKLLPL